MILDPESGDVTVDALLADGVHAMWGDAETIYAVGGIGAAPFTGGVYQVQR